MMAAQLFQTAHKEIPSLDEKIKQVIFAFSLSFFSPSFFHFKKISSLFFSTLFVVVLIKKILPLIDL